MAVIELPPKDNSRKPRPTGLQFSMGLPKSGPHIVIGNQDPLPPLPAGYVFVVDADGSYLIDTDGSFLITEA